MSTNLAGMCLLDTTDGALMMALYSSKAFAQDAVAILYYSIVLTGITVFVSAFIGIIQVLSLVQNIANPEGPFWDGVATIGDYFDVIGGCICGVFVVAGLGSVLLYKPWRRRMDRAMLHEPRPPQENETDLERGQTGDGQPSDGGVSTGEAQVDDKQASSATRKTSTD
jgi:high-affinity nickel-transport protein